MILRKPYAFLIKNFKLFHLIMTILMAYVFYKTWTILSVFNDYFASGTALIGSNASATTYTFMLFFIPVLIIIFSLILFWVMVVKKKPSSLYIITIIIYIYALAMFGMGKSTLLNMEINILDIRLIKMTRDLTTIAFILQIYPLVKSLVRAVGFDIKQFDFGKDLAELEIEEADSEEFEVNVSVDTNKVKRGFNFRKREFRYLFVENKVLIILSTIVILAIIGGVTVILMLRHGVIKNIGESFTVSSFTFKVNNAYITRKDYKGNTLNLNEKMSLLVIPFKVKNNSDIDKSFLTANIMLDIGDHRFRNSIIYRDSMSDLGVVYNGENIKSKTEEYKTFIFEVPTNYLSDKIELKFITSISTEGKDLIPTYITVNINPKDLDSKLETFTLENGNTDLSKTILKNSNITIENTSIAKKFKIDYKYKVSDTEAIDSYEYIYAPLDTNVDKSLLKITGELSLGEGINITDLYDLINTYGYIKYELNGQTKKLYTLNKVNPSYTKSSKTLYIGVPSDMEKASSVSLILNIRGKEYTYKIK